MTNRMSLERGGCDVAAVGCGRAMCGNWRAVSSRELGRAAAAILLFLASAALRPAAAAAQDSRGDTAAGRQLARTWCSGCHKVEAGATGSANDAVPSFAAIARMPSTTTLSVTAFLRTTHPPMPDFRLTEAQIADVSAYIGSLRGQ